VIRSLPLLYLCVLVACTSQSGGSQLPEADYYVNPGQQFALRVGETAAVVASQTFDLVRFNGVAQDNRCPVDVQCPIAGAATVLLTVQTSLAIHDVTLDVPPDGEAEIVVEELTVRSFGVRPNAAEGVTIPALDYVVGLTVRESSTTPLPN
jgi:hypothetical protein